MLTAGGSAHGDLGLGIGIGAMVDLALTPLQFARGFAQEELAEAEQQRRTGLDEASWRAHMMPSVVQLVESGEHPNLIRMITENDHTPEDADSAFDRRLTMILDGMAASLRTA